MDIAMIGHKRIPSRSGGVEVVVGELSKRMADMGCSVVAYNRNSGEDKISEYEGVKIVEIPTPKKSAFNASVYSFIATLRAGFSRSKLIHYHAEGPCAALPLAKLFGKRTVATIHGLDWQRAKWGAFAKNYLLLGEKMAAKYADELIVLSKPMQNYFKEKYNRESIIISNGVDKREYAPPKIIKKAGLEKDGYILFLARITPEKGLDVLIDAYRRLDTDKKLIIAGALEPETDYIRHIKGLCGGDERIKLYGFASGDEVTELFSNCFLYVLPSAIEGMPISLLEALSCGARIIASDIPENADVIKGYGTVFETGNTESLYEAIKKSLENPDFYGDGIKGREEAEKFIEDLLSEHDWDHIVRQTLEAYRRVLEKKR